MSGRPAKTPGEAGPTASSPPATRSTRWAPGQSGNPRGRPQGSRNRTSLLLEHLIEGEGEAVVRSLLASAKGGDTSAARALLDRLVPPRKERPLKVVLPELRTAKDARDALAAVTAAVADGQMLPGEGETVVRLLESYARTAAAAELEERVAALEVRLAGA
jgi:Family of unknown function (DUF5681)